MDRADKLTAVTAGRLRRRVAGPGRTQALDAAMRKKRTAEAADLVAGNQEHAEAAEYFSAMTECCEALGGVKILSCDEVPVDSPLKALTASAAAATSEEEAAKMQMQMQQQAEQRPPIAVRLLLWGRHTLTLTLSPQQQHSASVSRRDILSHAHLETNFEGEDSDEAEDAADGSSNSSSSSSSSSDAPGVLSHWRRVMLAATSGEQQQQQQQQR